MQNFLMKGIRYLSPEGKKKENPTGQTRESERRKHKGQKITIDLNHFDQDKDESIPRAKAIQATTEDQYHHPNGLPRKPKIAGKRRPKNRGKPLNNTWVGGLQVPALKKLQTLPSSTQTGSSGRSTGPLEQAKRLQAVGSPLEQAQSLQRARASPRLRARESRHSDSLATAAKPKPHHQQPQHRMKGQPIKPHLHLCDSDWDTDHEESLPPTSSNKVRLKNVEAPSSEEDSLDSRRKSKRPSKRERPVATLKIPSVSYENLPRAEEEEDDHANDDPISGRSTICRLPEDDDPHRTPAFEESSPIHPGDPSCRPLKKIKTRRHSGGNLPALQLRTVDSLDQKYSSSFHHHYEVDIENDQQRKDSEHGPPTSSLPSDLQLGVLGTPRHPGAPRHPYEAISENKRSGAHRRSRDHNQDGRPRASPPTADGSGFLRNFVVDMEGMDLEVPKALPQSKPTGGSLFCLSKANNQHSTTEERVRTSRSFPKPSSEKTSQRSKPQTIIRPGCTLQGHFESPKKPPASPKSEEREFQWREGEDEDFYASKAKPRRRSSRLAPSATRRSSREPEILEIDDSDSEVEEVHSVDPSIREYSLTRIAIGKTICLHECKAFYHFKSKEIRLEWRRKKKKKSDGRRIEMTLGLNDGTMEQMAFYRSKVRDTVSEIDAQDSKVKTDEDLARELGSFCAMRVKPTVENTLVTYNNYRPEGGLEEYRYIVVEFRNQEDVMDFWNQCCPLLGPPKGFEVVELDIDSCPPYSRRLLQHLRTKWNGQNQDNFVRGLAADHLLLVYPFDENVDRIEQAAEGLTEASAKVPLVGDDTTDTNSDDDSEKGCASVAGTKLPNSDQDPGIETTTKKKRAHFVTLRVDDYTRLDPGEWLNDSLVDFWMQWISREDASLASKFHFFTSHFFTTLQSSGPSAVASWTKRKKINIFEKKLIFIPINKDLHWSLCVLVNPGVVVTNVQRNKKSDPLSCMIFMDSLRMHNKKTVSKIIRGWLNNEWKEINQRMHGSSVDDDPFIVQTFRMFSPRVPLQNNTWDCGVFVCRYAYAVYELRNRNFTCEDAGLHCEDDNYDTEKKPLVSLISDSAEFNFNMEDIARFRVEFKTLIERLSKIYHKFKRAEKEQERQRRVNGNAAGDDAALVTDEPVLEVEAKMSSRQELNKFKDPTEGPTTSENALEKENIGNSSSIICGLEESTKLQEPTMLETTEANALEIEELEV